MTDTVRCVVPCILAIWFTLVASDRIRRIGFCANTTHQLGLKQFNCTQSYALLNLTLQNRGKGCNTAPKVIKKKNITECHNDYLKKTFDVITTNIPKCTATCETSFDFPHYADLLNRSRCCTNNTCKYDQILLYFTCNDRSTTAPTSSLTTLGPRITSQRVISVTTSTASKSTAEHKDEANSTVIIAVLTVVIVFLCGIIVVTAALYSKKLNYQKTPQMRSAVRRLSESPPELIADLAQVTPSSVSIELRGLPGADSSPIDTYAVIKDIDATLTTPRLDPHDSDSTEQPYAVAHFAHPDVTSNTCSASLVQTGVAEHGRSDESSNCLQKKSADFVVHAGYTYADVKKPHRKSDEDDDDMMMVDNATYATPR